MSSSECDTHLLTCEKGWSTSIYSSLKYITAYLMKSEVDKVWFSVFIVIFSSELQKEGLKDFKKAKGKFKPTKVFKMLNH